MSHWGGDPSAQPPAPGQVTFFDPAAFQKKLVGFPPVNASQPASIKGQSHSQASTSVSSSQGTHHNAWDSWGANPFASDFTATGQGSGNDATQQNAYTESSQQQWYEQNQWEANQQSVSHEQWEQGQWDPNNQWNQNHYQYQQGSDPNQTGYNGYWGGEDGSYQQGEYTNWNDQNSEGANYFTGDPNVQYGQSGTNYSQTEINQELIVSTDNVPGQTEGHVDDLDVSHSTESGGQSLNQSLGNVENGDDFEDDEDESDGSDEDDVDENNSNLGGSGSHMPNQNDEGSQATTSVESEDMISQMHGLTIQNNIVPHNAEQQSETSSGEQFNSNQRNDASNGEQLFVPQTQQHAFLPPQSELKADGNNDANENNGDTDKQTTPTFSDWEMVPHQTVSASHSRNPSTDNTVKFFISSNNSSARVSPATSTKAVDDHIYLKEQVGDKKEDALPREHGLDEIDAKLASSQEAAQEPGAGPPPNAVQALGPPPPMSRGSKGTNPFRKSPNMEPTLSSSGGDVSVLSSTRLDVTRPNFENSPVVLNRSISPIQPDSANRKTVEKEESPEFEDSDKHHSTRAPDTPVSSHPKKGTAVPQSPIMPRKESPFQPPGQEQKNKPMKASHDIGIQPLKPVTENSKTGSKTTKADKSGRDQDVNAGRRTPEWDSGEGHKTSMDRRVNRERGNNERERDRYGRDKDGDRLQTRPPSGSGAADRRTRQSAFHHIQTSRNKNNVSPAASLLDVAESVPSMSNILLMPASNTVGSSQTVSGGPKELNPVVSLISSMSEQITDKQEDNEKSAKNSDRNGDRDRVSKERYEDRDSYARGEKSRIKRDRDQDRTDIHRNRSYDSLRGREDSRNYSQEGLSAYNSRDSLDRDDSRDRSRRGGSRERERSYRDEYYDRYRDRNRPPSRTSTVDTRRDYRDRDSYRRRDRYDRDPDRPRSRQGDRDRPLSRHGESDRPRSRTDYDREIEKYREKYKDYSYDDYYRRQYYDPRYYDYYYGNNSQAGYYDEYGYYRAEPPRFDYPPGLHDYSQRGYEDYYSYYGYEQNGHRWDPTVSAWVATTTEAVPQRQTPEKFMIPHVRACFGPMGQLIKVLPNRPADGQPGTVEIHSVQSMLEDEEEAQCLSDFPGPLVRGDTHKNDALLFCQNQAKLCAQNMDLPDRESAELIWKFLELLIKQNGTIVGTDIADLVLQGHEPTTQEYRRSGVKIAPSSDNLDIVDDESEDGQKLSRGSTPIDRSVINKGKSVEEVTDRFRHLLMYGRKKDALDWAMKNNLWGHALFLASKMDSRAHANVMTRFANVAMRMNDPLQTLYQLMSGRQPAAVTCIGEDRWGEWRPHLAMILSNHSQKPDLDRKSITTLGDTLASRGFLHASHFCYLMSQTGFGSYQKKSSKIVLIGSSHGLPLEHFANNTAIQCTEIYEYGLSLANATFSLSNFQTFKFLYATRLSDYGLAQEALQYCEVISRHINMNPAYYPHILVKLVYDLASQLKFSQPQLEDDEELPDPDWLRALHTTLVQFEEGAIQAVSGTVTPAFFGGRTTASSDSGEVGMYMQGTDNGSMYTQDAGYQPATGGMYSIHEHSHYQPSQAGLDGQQYQGTEYTEGFIASQQYSGGTGGDHHSQAEVGADNQFTHEYQQGDHLYQHQAHVADGSNGTLQWPEQGYASTTQNHSDQHQEHQGTQEHWSHHPPHKTGFHPDVNLGESQTSITSSAKRSSIASTSGVSQEEIDHDVGQDQTDSFNYNETPSIFDIQPAQSRIIPPKLRKRTISESSTGSGRDRHPSGNQGQHPQQSSQKAPEKDLMSETKQKPGATGGGIWGKIGGLFSRKNEMKLPDDKEPSIVWDPVKKRWVDKDADEQDEKPPAPPPKDHELPGSGAGNQVPAGPGLAPGPAPPGGADTALAGGNKFSRRRGPKYVDVMNPKPATSSSVPSSLFHTLPSSRSAPAIFNPMGNQDNGPADLGHQVDNSIPEEKDSGAENSKQNLTIPPLNDNAITSSTAAATMPAMYNPTQFGGDQSFKQPAAAGPGHRLTNRRVYPKR